MAIYAVIQAPAVRSSGCIHSILLVALCSFKSLLNRFNTSCCLKQLSWRCTSLRVENRLTHDSKLVKNYFQIQPHRHKTGLIGGCCFLSSRRHRGQFRVHTGCLQPGLKSGYEPWASEQVTPTPYLVIGHVPIYNYTVLRDGPINHRTGLPAGHQILMYFIESFAVNDVLKGIIRP